MAVLTLLRVAGAGFGVARFACALLVVLLAACSGVPPTPLPATSTPTANSAPSPSGLENSLQSAAPGQTDIAGAPPTPAPEEPTSAELIQADLDAGKIDQPTAILYRVYATFGDGRLPGQYATGTWTEDSAALAHAVIQLDTFPTDVASSLEPFLARPTDPISVFNQAQTGRLAPPAFEAVAKPAANGGVGTAFALANQFTPADFICEPSGWGHIDGGVVLGQPAWKVWGRCNDAAWIDQVVTLAGWVQQFWDTEIALMGPPVRDTGGGPAEAGDGPIDIYLTDQCVSTAGRCLGNGFGPKDGYGAIAYTLSARPFIPVGNSDKASSFMVFQRSRMGPDVAGTVAHELFHVLQAAHNNRGTLVGGGWHWFVEASAKWAQWFYYSPSRPRAVYPWFNDFQNTALGLTTTDGSNEYASYTWPLFMQQNGDEHSIAAAWTSMEGQSGSQALDDAISGVLPFESDFHEFAVTAWNEPLTPAPDPVDPHFWDLDGAMPQNRPTATKTRTESLTGHPRGTPPLKIVESMPPLSARYADLTPDDKVHQLVVDFSNLSPADYLDVDALVHIRDKGWERRQLPKGQTRFCLDDENDAVQELIVVLSNHESAEGHDITGSWTVESLEEPCAGWDVEIDWTDVYDGVADTIHFKGLVDSIDDSIPGDEFTIYMTGVGTASGARAGWKGCNPGIDVTPEGSGKAIFQAAISDATITVNAFADIDNPLAGITTDLFEAKLEDTFQEGGATVTIDPRQPIGDLCPHYSYGAATITALTNNGPPPAAP